MTLIPLSKIKDDQEFSKGSRFRQYGIGLNVSSPEEDYYEYMLAAIPGRYDYMLLTCVEGYKAGSALALVEATTENKRFVVTGKAIKYSMGTDKTFWLSP